MDSAVNIATYITHRYRNEYGTRIDEMKLHKLMYFCQRESLLQLGHPLFNEQFYAWKYGPVLPKIRAAYRLGLLNQPDKIDISGELKPVFDTVFTQYAHKDSWSLSRISHGEYSWQNARIGLGPIAHCENPIAIEDIRADANRIKLRRYFIKKMALATP